jgi:hypothetical protein
MIRLMQTGKAMRPNPTDVFHHLVLSFIDFWGKIVVHGPCFDVSDKHQYLNVALMIKLKFDH